MPGSSNGSGGGRTTGDQLESRSAQTPAGPFPSIDAANIESVAYERRRPAAAKPVAAPPVVEAKNGARRKSRRDQFKTIPIRPFTLADRDAVRPLYQANFGERSWARLERRWQWQFVDNPACRYEAPRAWVADDDGQVVAYMGSHPARLKVGDEELTVFWECDFAAKPNISWTDPTLAERMNRAFVDDPRHILNGGTEYTNRQLRIRTKLKHRAVPGLTELISRPVRGGAMARYFAETNRAPKWMRSGPSKAVLCAVASIGVAAAGALTRPRPDRSVDVRPLENAPEEVDALWARLKPKFPVIVVRDRAFVQWRFFDDPCFDHDVFGAFASDGTLVGYIAVRVDEKDGVQRGRIMDLFCDPAEADVARSLLAAGLRCVERKKPDTIECRGLHPELRRIVRKSFFYPPPGRRSEVLAYFLWKGPEELSETIYEGANWHFARADGSAALNP
jgi:hypothetical protein